MFSRKTCSTLDYFSLDLPPKSLMDSESIKFNEILISQIRIVFSYNIEKFSSRLLRLNQANFIQIFIQ